MARMRTCKLCGAAVKANVAAHDCPHGNTCRYLCGDDDLPVDWETPECPRCQSGAEDEDEDSGDDDFDPSAVKLRLVKN